MVQNIGQSNTDPRDKAENIAIKEFKKLGEKNVKKDNLQVINISTDGVDSFLVKSNKNNIQINKADFSIMRINGKTAGQ